MRLDEAIAPVRASVVSLLRCPPGRAQGDEVVRLNRKVDGVDIADPDSLTDAVMAAKPEAVYHLPGASDIGGSWAEPRETFVANALGTLNVLDASRQAGAERVLAVTSADVYGRVTEDELPLDEGQPLRPVSPYAASKVAADALAQQAWLGHGLPVIQVRAFNHLGPGQSDRFLARRSPLASPATSAMAATTCRSATSRPSVMSPTCGTWCGHIGC